MEITKIRVFAVHEDKLKAYVSITLDDVFIVRDLRIIQGTNGLFVAMPNKKMRDGTFRDIAHPLNSETRKWMEDKVLAEYESLAQESSDDATQSQDSVASLDSGM